MRFDLDQVIEHGPGGPKLRDDRIACLRASRQWVLEHLPTSPRDDMPGHFMAGIELPDGRISYLLTTIMPCWHAPRWDFDHHWTMPATPRGVK